MRNLREREARVRRARLRNPLLQRLHLRLQRRHLLLKRLELRASAPLACRVRLGGRNRERGRDEHECERSSSLRPSPCRGCAASLVATVAGEMARLLDSRSVRFRALDGALPPLGPRSGEPVGGRRALARRRRPRGADRRARRRRRRRAARRRDRRRGRKLLGAEFDLDPFYAFAATEPVLARVVPPVARPAAAARAGSVRVAGHVDHRAAGLAARGVRDPRAG